MKNLCTSLGSLTNVSETRIVLRKRNYCCDQLDDEAAVTDVHTKRLTPESALL